MTSTSHVISGTPPPALKIPPPTATAATGGGDSPAATVASTPASSRNDGESSPKSAGVLPSATSSSIVDKRKKSTLRKFLSLNEKSSGGMAGGGGLAGGGGGGGKLSTERPPSRMSEDGYGSARGGESGGGGGGGILKTTKSGNAGAFRSLQPDDLPSHGNKSSGTLDSSNSPPGAAGAADTARKKTLMMEFSEGGFQRLRQMWKDRELTNPLKRTFAANSSSAAKKTIEISGPTDFKHVAHVAFDTKTLTYEGLPPEWLPNANSSAGGSSQLYTQFGCSITSCPRVVVPGYKERIPAVLVQLRDELERNNGLSCEGVFRVAASFDDQNGYKREIDTGTFKGCRTTEDVMCMAALLKEWFRTMPVRLLNALPLESIRTGKSNIELELPEPHLSVFSWFVDLMAQTVELEEQNRMNAKAMAIVIAPNLYAPHEKASPKEIMMEMAGAVNIVETALNASLARRREAKSSSSSSSSSNGGATLGSGGNNKIEKPASVKKSIPTSPPRNAVSEEEIPLEEVTKEVEVLKIEE